MMRIFTIITTLIFGITSVISAQTMMSIAEARATNADGTLINDEATVILEGKAIGPNFRPAGQTFSLIDVQESIGITVFALDSDLGYTVNDNDNLRVTGSLTQFNGLAEIVPTMIEVLAPGGPNPTPIPVTVLDENTESNLIVFKDAMLVDPSQWGDSGSFNLEVTNGSETITIRIDSDTDISGQEAPTGTFDITGIGGQFDNSSPYVSGYQLFPRRVTDIAPYNGGTGGGGDDFRVVTMPDLRANDADGVPALIGEKVEATAVVHGINLRPSGLQFTIIDNNNVGVAIFSNSEQLGYTVTEGDLITIQGELAFFNGLTQIVPESINVISQGNPPVEPRRVTTLDETTESSLVVFYPQDVEDATQWTGDGSSFNVNFLNEIGEVVTIRIDSDTANSSVDYPGALGTYYIGIGGQFDNSAPHDQGYQMLPRYNADIVNYTATNNIYKGQLSVYPNPTQSQINVAASEQIESLSLFSMTGQLIKKAHENTMLITELNKGMYILQVNVGGQVAIRKISIQ